MTAPPSFTVSATKKPKPKTKIDSFADDFVAVDFCLPLHSVTNRPPFLRIYEHLLMLIHIHLSYFSKLMTVALLSLEKHSSSTDAHTIYKATGKLSLETVNEFIQRMRPEPTQHLVLDMSGVTFLDSAGVGALVSLFVNRRSHGKTFALAALAPQASAVVTVAGLQKLLPIYPTVDEAAKKT
jgi:anti-sigma B factor antagonist